MSGKEEISIGGVVLALILVLAIMFGGGDSSNTSQLPVSSNTETWRNYVLSPSNEDVLVQLENSQKLIIALGNDLSRLQTQNVDIQSALLTVNTQLSRIQQQAAEDAKRQTRENWKFAIVGIVGGWLANFVFPTENLATFVGKLFGKRRNDKINPEKNGTSVPNVTTDLSTNNVQLENLGLIHPEKNVGMLEDMVGISSPKQCPKCKSNMKIGPARQGEFKNRFVYACPTCHEIIPFGG